jgi:hypothetical protein
MRILPPGTYFIGDPCYVFSRDAWRRLINQTNCFEDDDIVNFDGQDMYAFGTSDGDGVYQDQNGVEYGVDSGNLGVVPIELIDNPEGEEHGTTITADEGMRVQHRDGTFWFNNICIKTNSDDEEEYGDSYDDPDADELDYFDK